MNKTVKEVLASVLWLLCELGYFYIVIMICMMHNFLSWEFKYTQEAVEQLAVAGLGVGVFYALSRVFRTKKGKIAVISMSIILAVIGGMIFYSDQTVDISKDFLRSEKAPLWFSGLILFLCLLPLVFALLSYKRKPLAQSDKLPNGALD